MWVSLTHNTRAKKTIFFLYSIYISRIKVTFSKHPYVHNLVLNQKAANDKMITFL